MLIILISSVSAHITLIRYGGAVIKPYHPDINMSQCIEVFDAIGPEHFEGLRYIKIFPQGTRQDRDADYVLGSKGIRIYQGYCDRYTLEHELCHYKQEQKEELWHLIIKHSGSFNDCLAEWDIKE